MVNAKRPTERSRHIDISYFAIQDWKEAHEICCRWSCYRLSIRMRNQRLSVADLRVAFSGGIVRFFALDARFVDFHCHIS